MISTSVVFAQQAENDKMERIGKRWKEQTGKIREKTKDVKENFEKFKLERTEFISKKMNLTEDEKEKFWPLADELHLKKFELNKSLRKEIREIYTARKENRSVSDAEYQKIIELSAQLKVKEAQLEQEYLDKFIKVVSAEKIFIYQEAELQFGKTIIGRHEKREYLPARPEAHKEENQ
jgi:Spy/CpxP family protein refolding chaperone